MPGVALGWEYLTGCAVATDPASRDRAEWPPHPARVFMAMAAAWFETVPVQEADETAQEEHAAEGEALRWIETLGEPEMWLPPAPPESERSSVTYYVPVNDKGRPAAATLQCAPALTRSKQARFFPSRHVGHGPCYLHWPSARDGCQGKSPEPAVHRQALAQLCGKVTRIGHSSSLVRMWVADETEIARLAQGQAEHWHTDEAMATAHCRRIERGFLDALPEQTQILRIEAFAEHVFQVQDALRAVCEAKASGDAGAKKAANKALEEAKARYEQALGEPYKKAVTPPPRLRPRVGLWSGYRKEAETESERDRACSHFDADLLVLVHAGGSRLPLASTLAAAGALRDMVMSTSGIQPVPEWVSGHDPDGSRSRSAVGHLAVVPLPFVGHEHADGHLMGMALAFPRNIHRRERGRVLGPLVVDGQGQPQEVLLQLGRLGVWRLLKRDWTEKRRALTPETWTAHPDGSKTWASVTPVVLDKFPKADRRDPKQREAWEQEVRGILAQACARIGLPRPIHIDIDTTSWHLGSPRAVTKRRRLRGEAPGRQDAALGDGFPDFPAKGTHASRPQVHVFLQFAEPVLGPVLLGAGRYRGYGLLKPW